MLVRDRSRSPSRSAPPRSFSPEECSDLILPAMRWMIMQKATKEGQTLMFQEDKVSNSCKRIPLFISFVSFRSTLPFQKTKSCDGQSLQILSYHIKIENEQKRAQLWKTNAIDGHAVGCVLRSERVGPSLYLHRMFRRYLRRSLLDLNRLISCSFHEFRNISDPFLPHKALVISGLPHGTVLSPKLHIAV